MYLSQLESRKFEGVDATLGISLYDYGICWKEFKRDNPTKGVRKGEYVFYHWTGTEGMFGFGCFHPDNFQSDFDWADFEDVAGCNSMTVDEWMEIPFPHRVYDLMSYYGTENVFGTTYYPFEITSNQFTAKERSKVIHRNGFPHPRKENNHA